MRTLYRIVAQTVQGEVYVQDELLNRASAARRVRSLNERSRGRGLEYRAEVVDIAELTSWQLASLFQADQLTYDELCHWAGQRVAEQALDCQRSAVKDKTKERFT